MLLGEVVTYIPQGANVAVLLEDSLPMPIRLFDATAPNELVSRLRYKKNSGAFTFVRAASTDNFKSCDLLIFQVCAGDEHELKKMQELLEKHRPRPAVSDSALLI